MHSITALICTHHLRSSSAISEPTTDATTHFCASCEAYQALCEEVDASRHAWQELEGPAKAPAAPYAIRMHYKEALKRCRKATAIWAMIKALREDNDDPAKPTLDVNGQPAYAGEDQDSYPTETKKQDLKARFAHSAQDRSEGEYRRPSEFNRKKYRYRPGRHADSSEVRLGFWNTNDPERDRWYAENTGTSFWDTSNTKLDDARPGGGDSVRNEGEGLDDPLPPLPKPEEDEERQSLNDSSCEAERGREDDDEDDESKEGVDLPEEGAWDLSSDFDGGDDEALGIEHGAAADSDGQGSERDSGDEAEAGRPEARGNDQADPDDDAAAP